MQPDLTSVLAKLRPSESHFQKVKEKIDAWLKSDAYSLIPERNKDLTEWVLIAKLTGAAPDLEQWSLEMGDAITNLRDCLDHLIYAFAQFETRNDPSAQIDKLAFLIVDDEAQFRGDSRRRLKHLSLRVASAIEPFQPYNRPNAFVRPLLAILRDLANANKHRLLQVAAAAICAIDIELRRLSPDEMFGRYSVFDVGPLRTTCFGVLDCEDLKEAVLQSRTRSCLRIGPPMK